MPLEEGSIVGRRYKLGRELGRGAAGVVIEAVHVHLDERVAIKFLLPEAARLPDLVARFLREGRAAVRLRSPHVVRVLDVDLLDDDVPFLVMEHLEGDDLTTLRKRSESLPIERAVGWVLEAAEGLAEAHAMGIVHRDVKPGNLFLARRSDGTEVVKVLDFGVSKVGGAIADATGTGTSSTAILGSPVYMAPEQILAAREVDARADVWSLGVTLYELLTGQRPFRGATLPDVCRAVLSETPQPPSALRPEIVPALDRAVLKCLDRDMSARFRDMGDLAAALAPFGGAGALTIAERARRHLDRAPPSAEPAGSVSAVTTPAAGAVSTATAVAPQRVLSLPALVRSRTAALAAVVVMSVVAGLIYLRSPASSTPGTAAAATASTTTALDTQPPRADVSPSAAIPVTPSEIAPSASAAPATSASPKAAHAPVARPRASAGARLPTDRL